MKQVKSEDLESKSHRFPTTQGMSKAERHVNLAVPQQRQVQG